MLRPRQVDTKPFPTQVLKNVTLMRDAVTPPDLQIKRQA